MLLEVHFLKKNEFIDSTLKNVKEKDDCRCGNYLLLNLQKISLDEYFLDLVLKCLFFVYRYGKAR